MYLVSFNVAQRILLNFNITCENQKFPESYRASARTGKGFLKSLVKSRDQRKLKCYGCTPLGGKGLICPKRILLPKECHEKLLQPGVRQSILWRPEGSKLRNSFIILYQPQAKSQALVPNHARRGTSVPSTMNIQLEKQGQSQGSVILLYAIETSPR